jgi:hypothetical protein
LRAELHHRPRPGRQDLRADSAGADFVDQHPVVLSEAKDLMAMANGIPFEAQ